METDGFWQLSPAARSVKPGRYRHFKGKFYRVLGVAKHSETTEEFVVYRPEYVQDEVLCIRPLAMFVDEVDRDGHQGPRFSYLRE